MARKILSIRYSILPFYYTLFFKAHAPVTTATSPAATVTRPLFFEFPSDVNTYGIHTQFLVGPAIMISPVTTQGEKITKFCSMQFSVHFMNFFLPTQNFYSVSVKFVLYKFLHLKDLVFTFLQVQLQRLHISPRQGGLTGTTSWLSWKKAGKR